MAFFSFYYGSHGDHKVTSSKTIIGEGVPSFSYFSIAEGQKDLSRNIEFAISGFTSNLRYTEKSELSSLKKVQEDIGLEQKKSCACILISKSPAWWALTQDERRSIFENDSHHIEIGLRYLPGISRRLHHSRDLGESFDFVTYFEFPTNQEEAFNSLLNELRNTSEWKFVSREYEIRFNR